MKNKDRWIEEAWNKVEHKVERISKEIGSQFPHASVEGQYGLEQPHWWTAGFWPGLLWLVYRENKNEELRKLATECEEKLNDVIFDFDRLDHDMGFMWILTSVARYKTVEEEDARKKALLVANLFMGRFNLNGNYIRAWNPWSPGEDNSGWAIIDCTMNISLLFWASEISGDPRYKHVAKKHADTVINHFIREDGSVHHIIRFDSESGEKLEAIGGQGYSHESAWSRGAAWAIYGLALCYQYTKEDKYLQAAKKAAHYFIVNLPEDYVPVWDFRIPQENEPFRDSSAGAIAAAGLLVLSDSTSENESKLYYEAGENILYSLYTKYGEWENTQEQGLISKGTSHVPEGKNIHVPLIYGDYFFTEGLLYLKGRKKLFW
ncbi:putative glycosyl hydrolase [Bacillus sp. TS-2]|nr:putative glycosyl hydrolase [Bacillus sp. TS-2]